MQTMYIQLGNPKHTPVLLEGASTRLPFLSYDPGLKSDPTIPRNPPYEARPADRRWVSPHKFYHGYSPPPNNSSNGQCNTPINFLGALSCRKVLSFMANCNSGPYYVFGTFKFVVGSRWRTRGGMNNPF